MNSIMNVKKDIEGIIGLLVQEGLSVYQNYPVIKQMSEGFQTVEWSNIINLSVTLKNISYEDVYNEIDKNKDYTIKLIDGNIVQMQYTYHNNHLFSHRLAMFPSPTLLSFEDDPEIYEKDEMFGDILARNIVSVPIRFDYSKNDIESEHEHPKSHVTLGQYKNCRIPAYGPISPVIFIQFVLKNFYNSIYNTYIKGSLTGGCKNYKTIRVSETKELHFNVI